MVEPGARKVAVASIGTPCVNSQWEAYCQARTILRKFPQDAYRYAGYSGNPYYGSRRLIAKPEIKRRIEELKTAMATVAIDREQYTREEVLQYLLDVCDTGMSGDVLQYKGKTSYWTDQEGKFILDDNGAAIPMRKLDRRAVVSAAELLGIEKEGMFPRHSKIEHTKGAPFEGLTTEEILEEARVQLKQDLGWDLDLKDLLDLVKRAKSFPGDLELAPGQ
jgi:hypothetical protein